MSQYFQPENLPAALAWLAAQSGQVAAGCTDLLAAETRQNLAGAILDITGIGVLSGISSSPKGWRIGAATPWNVVRDAELPAVFDGLKQAASEIGSVQIQNAGTIGGNLCNASPAADGMPALLTLDTVVELASADGLRLVPLSEFITGPRQTVLRPDELMTALVIPSQAGHGAFIKLGARKYMVISIAMAAARVVLTNGRVEEAAIAIGACGPVAKRLARLEAALIGQQMDRALSLVVPSMILPEISPIADIRADQSYREQAAIEVVRRSLAMALEAAV